MTWETILIGIFLLAALAFLFIYLDARKKNKDTEYTIYDLNMRNKCYHKLLEQKGFSVEQLREIRWILVDDLKKVTFTEEPDNVQKRPHTEIQIINYFYKRQDVEGLINFAIARYVKDKPEYSERFKVCINYLSDSRVDTSVIKTGV